MTDGTQFVHALPVGPRNLKWKSFLTISLEAEIDHRNSLRNLTSKNRGISDWFNWSRWLRQCPAILFSSLFNSLDRYLLAIVLGSLAWGLTLFLCMMMLWVAGEKTIFDSEQPKLCIRLRSPSRLVLAHEAVCKASKVQDQAFAEGIPCFSCLYLYLGASVLPQITRGDDVHMRPGYNLEIIFDCANVYLLRLKNSEHDLSSSLRLLISSLWLRYLFYQNRGFAWQRIKFQSMW